MNAHKLNDYDQGDHNPILETGIRIELGDDPYKTTVDLWDLGSDEYAAAPSLPTPTEYQANLDEVGGDSLWRSKAILGGIAILVAFASYFFVTSYLSDDDAWHISESSQFDSLLPDAEQGFLGSLWAYVNSLSPIDWFTDADSHEFRPPRPEPVAREQVTREVVEPKPEPPPLPAVVEGNPYWILPNQIRGSRPEMERPWGAGDKEAFGRGMASPYTYQKYRTVTEVRQRRLRGSEVILWQALAEPKFWTRMEAAAGLADFGIELDLAVIDQVIGNARPSLVANYLERFVKEATPGDLYVLRHAIRLVNERARLNILKAIRNHDDQLRGLYLAAAMYDPGPAIQEWIQTAIYSVPIGRQRLLAYQRIIEGKERAPLEFFADNFKVQEAAEREITKSKATPVEVEDFIDIKFFSSMEEQFNSQGDDMDADGFDSIEVIELVD